MPLSPFLKNYKCIHERIENIKYKKRLEGSAPKCLVWGSEGKLRDCAICKVLILQKENVNSVLNVKLKY